LLRAAEEKEVAELVSGSGFNHAQLSPGAKTVAPRKSGILSRATLLAIAKGVPVQTMHRFRLATEKGFAPADNRI